MNAQQRGIPAFCAVAIVGGGTAGLSLATELRRLGVGDVVVIEREAEAGGVPRHCGHYPFGLREYGRLMKGPDYARRNVARAQAAGVRVLTGTAVTGLKRGGVLDVSSDVDSARLTAARVVLCTGVREASRAQRFLGGDRPPGVIATGTLQDMVYLKGHRPFARPVILGSELVSLSAIMTCRHLGIVPLVMIDQFGRCSDPRYFAAGNLLRAAETSGWCWREGVDTARRIVADITRNGAHPAAITRLPIRFSCPALGFVVPQRIAQGGAAGAMVQMQLGLERSFSGRLVARSAGKVLWSGRLSGAPVRRILAPLAPILQARPNAPVDLALE
jgi:hypothetical protein